MATTFTLRGQQICDFVARIDQSKNTSRSTTVQERKEGVLEKITSILSIGLLHSPEVQTATGKTDGAVIPISGTTRLFALAEIVNPGCTGIFTEAEIADQKREAQPDFAVEVVVYSEEELSEFSRAVRNVVYNVGDKPSPVDTAKAIKALKDLGATNKDIAKHLGITDPNKPGRLLKILTLSQEFVDAIHKGDFSVEAGVLVAATKAPLAALLKAWIVGEFKASRYPTAKQVQTKIDQLTPKEETGEDAGGGGAGGDPSDDETETPENGTKNLSAEATRKFFGDYLRVIEAEDAEELKTIVERAARAIKAIGDLLEGNITEKEAVKILDRAFGLVG